MAHWVPSPHPNRGGQALSTSLRWMRGALGSTRRDWGGCGEDWGGGREHLLQSCQEPCPNVPHGTVLKIQMDVVQDGRVLQRGDRHNEGRIDPLIHPQPKGLECGFPFAQELQLMSRGVPDAQVLVLQLCSELSADMAQGPGLQQIGDAEPDVISQAGHTCTPDNQCTCEHWAALCACMKCITPQDNLVVPISVPHLQRRFCIIQG